MIFEEQYIKGIYKVSLSPYIDNRGAFESDDEVGTFFRNIKEIQTILNQFNNKN
jgi:hypothetical protein